MGFLRLSPASPEFLKVTRYLELSGSEGFDHVIITAPSNEIQSKAPLYARKSGYVSYFASLPKRNEILNMNSRTIQIIKACQIAKEAGVQFVKTSTGFGSRGASVNDVILMKRAVGPDIQIKASTGIKTREDADKMIKASATRLGTSSGIKIVHGE
jgi:hypothetical protein